MKTKECPKCKGDCRMSVTCGAYVCQNCGNHIGLVRCFCGWSADGGDGRAQLEAMGEVIDPEE